MSDPHAKVCVVKFWDRRTVGPIKAIHPTTGKIIEVDPQRDAKISSDYDSELRRLPALLSWYYALRDTASTRLREASHEEHNAEEDIYEELRARAEKSGGKKLTEQALKMALRRTPRMRAAFRARMDAEEMHERLASAAKAMEEKRWSLQNLVKNAAIERGTKDHF